MTVQEALSALFDEFHIEDSVYEVRARAIEGDPGYEGESWEHPKVLRFSEACKTLKAFMDKGGAS